MSDFNRSVDIRWSDLDPNFHLRHSVYYDWGAFCRMEFLNEYGLTPAVMQSLMFGPILFREECVFRREIRFGDEVFINLQLLKSRRDFSRWSIQHQVTKKDGTLSATLTVDGAWMSMRERKLATPPEQIHSVFNAMPRLEKFEWLT